MADLTPLERLKAVYVRARVMGAGDPDMARPLEQIESWIRDTERWSTDRQHAMAAVHADIAEAWLDAWPRRSYPHGPYGAVIPGSEAWLYDLSLGWPR